MLRIVFDVPRLKAKRRELEQISAQPEFWENQEEAKKQMLILDDCLLYTSPSPRDGLLSRMPSSA